MEIERDFKELLELLNSHRVEYLLVGAYALAFHGAPRFTGDLDVFVKPDSANSRRLIAALTDFGFGSVGLSTEDFETSHTTAKNQRGRAHVKGISLATMILLCSIVPQPAHAQDAPDAYDYRVLATNKTSTMQKEMSEAADAGYRMEKMMGGSSTFGGSEVIVVMAKSKNSPAQPRFAYKLLATSKMSTMQKELQEVGNEGFDYKDQIVFNSTFGGDEVVVILEMLFPSTTSKAKSCGLFLHR